MPLWGKEDKSSAKPKFVGTDASGTITQDNSGKKLVFLSAEEALANAEKGASGAGWYTVLVTNKGAAGERTRLERLVCISSEQLTSSGITSEELSGLSERTLTTSHAYNTDLSVFADAEPGKEDPQSRQGWYFTNTTAGKKVNWYFYSGSDTITLATFSAYAVLTVDSTSDDHVPFFGVYTAKQGAGDASGWYRSRKVYVVNGAPTPGVKYLVYFGTDPGVHPELPRLEMVPSSVATSQKGPQGPSEIVSLCSLGSNSASPANQVKFVAESLGYSSPSAVTDIELRLDSSDGAEDASGLN